MGPMPIVVSHVRHNKRTDCVHSARKMVTVVRHGIDHIVFYKTPTDYPVTKRTSAELRIRSLWPKKNDEGVAGP